MSQNLILDFAFNIALGDKDMDASYKYLRFPRDVCVQVSLMQCFLALSMLGSNNNITNTMKVPPFVFLLTSSRS